MHFSAIFAKIWDPKIWDNSGDLGSEAIFEKRQKRATKCKKARLLATFVLKSSCGPKNPGDNSGDLGSEDLGSEDLGSEDLG